MISTRAFILLNIRGRTIAYPSGKLIFLDIQTAEILVWNAFALYEFHIYGRKDLFHSNAALREPQNLKGIFIEQII